jgi:hypothetical protein
VEGGGQGGKGLGVRETRGRGRGAATSALSPRWALPTLRVHSPQGVAAPAGSPSTRPRVRRWLGGGRLGRQRGRGSTEREARPRRRARPQSLQHPPPPLRGARGVLRPQAEARLRGRHRGLPRTRRRGRSVPRRHSTMFRQPTSLRARRPRIRPPASLVRGGGTPQRAERRGGARAWCALWRARKRRMGEGELLADLLMISQRPHIPSPCAVPAVSLVISSPPPLPERRSPAPSLIRAASIRRQPPARARRRQSSREHRSLVFSASTRAAFVLLPRRSSLPG